MSKQTKVECKCKLCGDDNRIENLAVMPHSEHMKLHWDNALKGSDAK